VQIAAKLGELDRSNGVARHHDHVVRIPGESLRFQRGHEAPARSIAPYGVAESLRRHDGDPGPAPTLSRNGDDCEMFGVDPAPAPANARKLSVAS
jgi:hypothetical protein